MNNSKRPFSDADFKWTSESTVRVTENLAVMRTHALMSKCGAFTDEELEEYLEGADILGVGNFDGFDVVFGHDENRYDFIAIKSDVGGLHVVFYD